MKKDGKFLLSEGRARLLSLLKKHKSISKAAKEMGMSYRHAWGTIKKIEKSLGEKVVISKRGGEEGGASRLTEEGEELLRRYKNQTSRIGDQITHMYRNPVLATDGIVVIDDEVLLIRRGKKPFEGSYALPGGIVEYGERVEECVVREIKEETGVETKILDIVGVYSDPDRDPRGHFISVVYHLHPIGGELESGDDASEARLFSFKDLPELAFDHGQILEDFRYRWG